METLLLDFILTQHKRDYLKSLISNVSCGIYIPI
jgi:hypothetical protein